MGPLEDTRIIEVAGIGPIPISGPAALWSTSTAIYSRGPHRGSAVARPPAAGIGEHTDEILRELGLDEGEIGQFRSSNEVA